MNRTTYTTQRGVETTFRPYADLSTEEREQILRDYLSSGSVATEKKWNISNQTLKHVKYHNKALLAEIEEQNFRRAGL